MSRSLNFVISAPGKVILFGEHSVLYAEPGLATSIDRRTTLKFNTETNDIVVLNFLNLDLNLKIPLSKVNIILDNIASCKPTADKLADFIEENIGNIKEYASYNTSQRLSLQCVFYLLYSLLHVENHEIGAFKIEIASQLVVGAGTGSSASFSVCLAAALFRYSQFLGDRLQDGFNDEQKSIINNWSFCCEQIIHGKASGVDNFVCTYGSMVNISFGDEPKNKPTFRLLKDTVQLRVLLVDSGVNRNTAKMVEKVAELHDRNPSITRLIFKAIGEITRTAVQLLKDLNNCDEKNHAEKLFTKLEDLVSMNHGLLTSLGVSHPSLNKIVEISSQFGLKSKLTGAGGGGYAFVLIPPSYPEKKLEQCKKSLEEAGYSVADSKVGEKGLDLIS